MEKNKQARPITNSYPLFNYHPLTNSLPIAKSRPTTISRPTTNSRPTTKSRPAINSRPTAKYCKPQTHVHEFLGSVQLAEEGADRHNHRFAGISSQEIPIACDCIHGQACICSHHGLSCNCNRGLDCGMEDCSPNHVHEIFTTTDFFDHVHEICVLTGPAIPVDGGKHVHFAQGVTTVEDAHSHAFVVATLIENPLTPETAVDVKTESDAKKKIGLKKKSGLKIVRKLFKRKAKP